jgi:hypothetical protein
MLLILFRIPKSTNQDPDYSLSFSEYSYIQAPHSHWLAARTTQIPLSAASLDCQCGIYYFLYSDFYVLLFVSTSNCTNPHYPDITITNQPGRPVTPVTPVTFLQTSYNQMNSPQIRQSINHPPSKSSTKRKPINPSTTFTSTDNDPCSIAHSIKLRQEAH